jgi:hypothetical protein
MTVSKTYADFEQNVWSTNMDKMGFISTISVTLNNAIAGMTGDMPGGPYATYSAWKPAMKQLVVEYFLPAEYASTSFLDVALYKNAACTQEFSGTDQIWPTTIVYTKIPLADMMSGDKGEPPGTDTPETATTNDIAGIIEAWRGVWYSHYGDTRIDGYRVGRWSELKAVMGNKLSLFPNFDPDNPRLHDGYAIKNNDYFLFYDDTVYGEGEGGEGGNSGWGENMVFRYLGVVRAINIFNNNANTGAVIIEYLDGCYPQWSEEVLATPLPFFGMYYRVLNSDSIQMGNAVDLAALYDGKDYYTETATLQEAIAKNNAGNESEFMAWGVVWPQDREER